jgi:hypothetical protein
MDVPVLSLVQAQIAQDQVKVSWLGRYLRHQVVYFRSQVIAGKLLMVAKVFGNTLATYVRMGKSRNSREQSLL